MEREGGPRPMFRRWRNKYLCFQCGYGRVFTANSFTHRHKRDSRTRAANSSIRESPGSNSLQNLFK
jgi:hypothetical protein